MIRSKRILWVLGAGLAVSAGSLWADNATPMAATQTAPTTAVAPATEAAAKPKSGNPTIAAIQAAIDLDAAGNTTAAVEAFEKIQTKSKNLEAWRLNDEAGVYLKVNDDAKAVSLLEGATTANSKNYVAWNNLGTAYEETGDTDKALDAYQKSIDAAKAAGADSAKAEGNLAALQARVGATKQGGAAAAGEASGNSTDASGGN